MVVEKSWGKGFRLTFHFSIYFHPKYQIYTIRVFLNHLLTFKYPKITQRIQNQLNLKNQNENRSFFHTCLQENSPSSNSFLLFFRNFLSSLSNSGTENEQNELPEQNKNCQDLRDLQFFLVFVNFHFLFSF
jgi:hypothetical protein